jgi:hypothetical protein
MTLRLLRVMHGERDKFATEEWLFSLRCSKTVYLEHMLENSG